MRMILYYSFKHGTVILTYMLGMLGSSATVTETIGYPK